MQTTLTTRVKLAVMMAGALAFCAPAWSDVRILTGASSSEKMCYCDCDANAGAPMCAQMCELPKYENRSWATSCHKATESEPDQPSTTWRDH